MDNLLKRKKGPIVDPGVCRCCGASKRCRVLNVEYDYLDRKEVYTDLFVECFGLLFSNLDGEFPTRLICATCVSRLRGASLFKKQVLEWERKLLHSQIIVHDEVPTPKVDLIWGSMEIQRPESVHIDVNNDHIKNVESLKPSKVDLIWGPTEIKKPESVPKDFNNDEMVHVPTLKTELKWGTTEIKKPEPDPKDLNTVMENVISNADKTVEPTQAVELPKTKRRIGMRKEEHSNAKRQLLQKIQKMRERLKRMDSTVKKKIATKEQPKNFIDEDAQIYHNDCAIIENSYVIPFRTSYSSYSCVYCQQVFLSPTLLREHSLTHDQNKFRYLSNGKRPSFMDISRIDCRLCDMKIEDIKSFKNHVKTHEIIIYNADSGMLKFRLEDGALSCTDCDKTFVFFHALKRHMAEHYGSFICDICGNHYFDQHSLNIHARYSHKCVDKYPCQNCGKQFALKHNLYAHVSTIHRENAAYPCNRCETNFYSNKERRKHLSEIHGETKQYKCDTCGKFFRDMRQLREHLRSVHFKIFKHKCSICDKGFMLPSKLNDHIVTVHKNETVYNCDLCHKNYPHLLSLQSHMLFHRQIKDLNLL